MLYLMRSSSDFHFNVTRSSFKYTCSMTVSKPSNIVFLTLKIHNFSFPSHQPLPLLFPFLRILCAIIPVNGDFATAKVVFPFLFILYLLVLNFLLALTSKKDNFLGKAYRLLLFFVGTKLRSIDITITTTMRGINPIRFPKAEPPIPPAQLKYERTGLSESVD